RSMVCGGRVVWLVTKPRICRGDLIATHVVLAVPPPMFPAVDIRSCTGSPGRSRVASVVFIGTPLPWSHATLGGSPLVTMLMKSPLKTGPPSTATEGPGSCFWPRKVNVGRAHLLMKPLFVLSLLMSHAV